MKRPRTAQLETLLTERILVLDGAMGTLLQSYKLEEADYRGERFADSDKDLKGNHDLLCMTRPDVLREAHERYLEAGADVIETNTFSGTSIAQADYGLEAHAYEINLESAKIAQYLDGATEIQNVVIARALMQRD